MDLSKFIILIPAYNEESSITKVINSLSEIGFCNILVVDDASSDNTYEKAVTTGAVMLKHVINLGYGAATRTGFSWIENNENYEYVITADADEQHDAKDVYALAQKAIETNCDYIIGRRNFYKPQNIKVTATRRLIHILADSLLFLLTGTYIYDTHSGLRCIKTLNLPKIRTKMTGYSFSTEIILEALRNDFKIEYVPIKTIYSIYSTSKPNRAKISQSIQLLKELLS